ncbi:hypothetical protein [Deinococcus soli (ex Cha et al. 2016)]|uniref:hypothetical protein n=1 Tax=Deinococcus soli (ex Cha et al. 2016) TaxID=1309411 RepID=UPI00166EA066|nr:hypothetical protein [Deinococcus soli (ex Cha et al. 2016)]GGB64484.1 hypothetical protein GCM10008019_20720 [Deinococcus soli (ex Cha et al. 2016)]
MTAPETLGLPLEVQEELEVLVGPDAWAYHEALQTGRVDVVRAYRVRKNVRLVAADVLAAAAAAAQDAPDGDGEPKVKRFKVNGFEEEYFASTPKIAMAAARWLALADTLRQEVATQPMSLGAFLPSVDGWGIDGQDGCE